jgi:hypothetical protein
VLPGQDVSRVLHLTIQLELCDIPTAWTERAALRLTTGPAAPYTPDQPSQPSLAYDDMGRAHLAFVEGRGPDRRIRFARRPSTESTMDFVLHNVGASVALAADGATEAGGVDHPSLLWAAEEGRFWLYYSAVDGAGFSRVHRAVWSAERLRFERPSEVLGFSTPPTHALSAPTVVRDGRGQSLMVARAQAAGAAPRVVVFASFEGLMWTEVTGSDLAERLRSSLAGGRPTGAEAGALSLSTHGGAYWVHYARRRGARWSIAAMVSHDFLVWRPLVDGAPVLSRRDGAFDRVYVTQPSAASLGDEADLVYVGSDGSRDRLGLARRIATAWGHF